jgi:glycosyl-4,4'-diaponeurosporenoate acyltransferase
MAWEIATVALIPRVLLAVAWWLGTSVLVGWSASRLGSRALAALGAPLSPRGFEAEGRCYERLGVRRWKRVMPDAGAWFGGARKRLTGPHAARSLRQLRQELDRAELVHLVLLVTQWVPSLWLGPLWWLGPTYAVVANLPLVVVTRYARARLEVIRGRNPRPSPPQGDDPTQT